MISAIIPVHDGERYLAEAVESALAQTLKPVEVIVVDDGSTDASAAVARRFGPPVSCLSQAQSGAGLARWNGARLARGEFLAFLDADDLWLPDKLEKQNAAFTREPALEAVFGQARQFHSPDLSEEARGRIHCPAEPMPGVAPSGIMIRKESFLRFGPPEARWRFAEFPAWYAKALESGLRAAVIPELVFRRRLHAGNMSIKDRGAVNAEYVEILKRSLDRRRAKDGR